MMALQVRRQRHGAGCLPAFILGLAALVVHLGLRPQNFVSSSLVCRRSRPPIASAAARRWGRTALASRGGESEEALVIGDKVLATSCLDKLRYPGTIDSENADGTFTVRWDDPEGGSETEDVAPGDIRKVFIFKDYVVGDDVEALPPDDGRWFPGTVDHANGDGTFRIRWDDPDGGQETNNVKPEDIRMVTIFKDYVVGDLVDAVYPEEGVMYPATVVEVNDDGKFTVKWEDPAGGPKESVVGYKELQYPPIAVEKLEVGQKYLGQVRTITSFGAFVDIGADVDGLLHISRIARERIDDIHDYLEEGQQVDVWISSVRDDGKFGLTLVEGVTESARQGGPKDISSFVSVPPDTWLNGTVLSTASYGAFVSVAHPDGGPPADGLVHISQIKNEGFVEDIQDELQLGQEVQVRITTLDLHAGKLGLSMIEERDEPVSRDGPRDLSAFKEIPPDVWMTGTVVSTPSFGAFVQVTAKDGTKADGLVHQTRIREGFVMDVRDELSPGDKVRVRITTVDLDEGKMGLSMREPSPSIVTGPADLSAFEFLPRDTWLTGKVAGTAPFGAFVKVTAEDGSTGDGLVHVTEMEDGFINTLVGAESMGKEVQVRVLSVDTQRGRMSLSMMDPRRY